MVGHVCKETVSAVLEHLYGLGKIRSKHFNEIEHLISKRFDRTARPANISNWVNNTKPQRGYSSLALAALGLTELGLTEELWAVSPQDAAKAIDEALSGGIMGLIRRENYQTSTWWPGFYQVDDPNYSAPMGVVLPGQPVIETPQTTLVPGVFLSVTGRQAVRLTVSNVTNKDIHFRVIAEDVGAGRREFTYHQINAALGYGDTLNQQLDTISNKFIVEYTQEAPITRLWTFWSNSKFPAPWLSGNSKWDHNSKAINITYEQIAKMITMLKQLPSVGINLTTIHLNPKL